MPTYEYACRDCGQHVEVVQSFRDDPLTECPHCGGRLRKVYGAAGIIFKGSGYYVNDSRKQPVKAAADGGSNGKQESKETAAGDKGGDKSGAEKSAPTADSGTAAKSA